MFDISDKVTQLNLATATAVIVFGMVAAVLTSAHSVADCTISCHGANPPPKQEKPVINHQMTHRSTINNVAIYSQDNTKDNTYVVSLYNKSEDTKCIKAVVFGQQHEYTVDIIPPYSLIMGDVFVYIVELAHNPVMLGHQHNVIAKIADDPCQ